MHKGIVLPPANSTPIIRPTFCSCVANLQAIPAKIELSDAVFSLLQALIQEHWTKIHSMRVRTNCTLIFDI